MSLGDKFIITGNNNGFAPYGGWTFGASEMNKIAIIGNINPRGWTYTTPQDKLIVAVNNQNLYINEHGKFYMYDNFYLKWNTDNNNILQAANKNIIIEEYNNNKVLLLKYNPIQLNTDIIGNLYINNGWATPSLFSNDALNNVLVSSATWWKIWDPYISDLGIWGQKIANLTIGDSKIIDGTINGGTKIQAASILGNRIAANTITGTNLANNTITNNKMANLWVDTAQLIDNSVSSIKIQSGAVTFAKIQNPLTCDWI